MNYYENVDDLFLEGEIFKNIEGYNGDYQVSNFGRIKSFKKCRGKDIIILSQDKNTAGYLCVNLYKNGKKKFERIHHLLFETFNNYKLKEGECIHHLNKNPLYNDLDNFQLMTNSEHASLHMSGKNHPLYGKHPSEKTKELMSEKRSGENHPGVILTKQKVIKIRELSDEGKLMLREIAEIFEVHPSTISSIKNKRIWKNI